MANGLKNRVGKFWKGAVAQIEGVRSQVEKSVRARGATLGKELDRLRDERDRLLSKLGEQTLTWVNKSPVPMPAVVKQTVTRLNAVVDSLKGSQKSGTPAPAPAAKASAPTAAATKKAPAKKKAAKAKSAAKSTAKSAATKPNKAPVSKKRLDT